jgi:hypothetical protein
MSFTLPHAPLTPLDSTRSPTAEAVHNLREELYANAQSIHTELGGGQHGHLGLVMPEAEYLALAGEAYSLPERPLIPRYSIAANDAEIDEWKERYEVETKLFNEAHELHMQLRQLIIKAVPEMFIYELSHELWGFATF